MPAADDSVTKHLLERYKQFGAFGYNSLVMEFVVCTKIDLIRIGAHCRIDDYCKLEGGRGLTIGDYVHIASFTHLNIGGGQLFIGDRAAFASGAKIITGGNRPEGQSMSAVAPEEMQVIKVGSVMIGEDACVLTNAVVLPGCNLGVGARLAAGSVLTKSIPDGETWGGIPARRLFK